MEECRYSSIILDLGTRWRCGQLHAPVAGKLASVPIGWKTKSGRCSVEKNLLPLIGNRTPAFQLIARSYTN
jgi:hypothetical protein